MAPNGQLHRENYEPAITHPDGGQEWWRHGQVSRHTGPAVITADRVENWWNGTLLTERGPLRRAWFHRRHRTGLAD